MKSWPKWATILIIAVVVLCCCAILSGVGVFVYNFSITSTSTPFSGFTAEPFHELTPTLLPGVFGTPPSDTAAENLNTLENNIVPNSDLRELAGRLK